MISYSCNLHTRIRCFNAYIDQELRITITTTNTKNEHSNKVVTRLTSHTVNDPENHRKPFVVARFYDKLPSTRTI